jgi:hypothetical protein
MAMNIGVGLVTGYGPQLSIYIGLLDDLLNDQEAYWVLYDLCLENGWADACQCPLPPILYYHGFRHESRLSSANYITLSRIIWRPRSYSGGQGQNQEL